jgi:hypothetical protein
VSRLREQLRIANQEFADRIHEILHDEMLRQLGGQPPERSTPPARSVRPNRAAVPDETPDQRVVAFIEAHPGAMPKDLLAALRMNRKSAFEALARACAAGTIEKTGRGPSVRYSAVSKTKTSRPPPGRASRPAASPGDPVERLVAWIQAHPGARFGEAISAINASEPVLRRALQVARDSGAVRMVGSRFSARYYAAGAKEQSDVGEKVKVVTTRASKEASRPAPPPSIQATIPWATPAPVAPVAPPAPVVATPAPVAISSASAEDGGPALALLTELDASLASDMHPTRLFALLQALVAEIRQVKATMSPEHMLAASLDHAIQRIASRRIEKKLPFIVGLKRDVEADWAGMSKKWRDRIVTFDRDATVGKKAPLFQATPPRENADAPPPIRLDENGHVRPMRRIVRLNRH